MRRNPQKNLMAETYAENTYYLWSHITSRWFILSPNSKNWTW